MTGCGRLLDQYRMTRGADEMTTKDCCLCWEVAVESPEGIHNDYEHDQAGCFLDISWIFPEANNK